MFFKNGVKNHSLCNKNINQLRSKRKIVMLKEIKLKNLAKETTETDTPTSASTAPSALAAQVNILEKYNHIFEPDKFYPTGNK